MSLSNDLSIQNQSLTHSKPIDKVDASIALLLLAAYADGEYSEAQQKKL